LKIAISIDVWVWEVFNFGKDKLLSGSGADRPLAKDEAEALARAYAAFLANPYR